MDTNLQKKYNYTLKKFFLFICILTTLNSYAQKPVKVYRLTIDESGLPISKLLMDSTIKVLKKRLLNSGYKYPAIVYNKEAKEIKIATESIIEESFINNWLVRPCKVFFYETYSALELLTAMSYRSNQEKDFDKKKTFYSLLNIDDSVLYGRKRANIGILKISDTAEFYKTVKDMRPYMPDDCILAFSQKLILTDTAGLEVYALKNNEWKLPVHQMLDTAKLWLEEGEKSTVLIDFNKTGTGKFAAITGKNVNRAIAIVIDELVYSAPFVNSIIEGGHAEIAGGFSFNEAKQLAAMLSGGYIPIKLTLKKQAIK